MFEMDDKTLKNIQQKSLEMAKYFVEFCKEHDLLCYFCGGGCIGAVRHGGFVPWDDDIDFFMPRPDYEKLLEIWDDENKNEQYSLQVTTPEIRTKNQFATICDNNTTYIKSYMADLDINHGLSLDIIPLDGRPPKNGLYSIRRKIQIFWALVYSLAIIGEAPTNHGKLVTLLGKVFLKIFGSQKCRTMLWSIAEMKMTKYDFYSSNFVCELTTGPVFMRRDYPISWFESAKLLPFEDAKMPVPNDYDSYLKMAFGDYMTPPPVEQQTAHHDFEFIDIDTPFKEYYGKYYCVNEMGGEDKT